MKILMVCLGNICRSPLAEGVLQHIADEQHLGWQIDSAGTGGWHVGEGPDRRSTSTARKHGIDISKQVCRKFRNSDFVDFDHIYVMDTSNLHDVLAIAPDAQARKKVKLLLGDQEVPDPYNDDTLFEPVFKLVEDGCRGIVKSATSLT